MAWHSEGLWGLDFMNMQTDHCDVIALRVLSFLTCYALSLFSFLYQISLDGYDHDDGITGHNVTIDVDGTAG